MKTCLQTGRISCQRRSQQSWGLTISERLINRFTDVEWISRLGRRGTVRSTSPL
nr:unnamed protein product [Callosobruchus analis]